MKKSMKAKRDSGWLLASKNKIFIGYLEHPTVRNPTNPLQRLKEAKMGYKNDVLFSTGTIGKQGDRE
jgi:hypothetical protein